MSSLARIGSTPSDSGAASTRSGLSNIRRGDTIRQVNTVPPWARHEPELSSTHLSSFIIRPAHPSISSVPEPASSTATEYPASPSHWWDFALSRRRNSDESSGNSIKQDRKSGFRLLRGPRSRTLDREITVIPPTEEGHSNALRINVPTPPSTSYNPPEMSYTLAQTRTPGWDTPWTPIHPVPSQGDIGSSYDDTEEAYHRTNKNKTWRHFVLYSNYPPILIRLLNLSFTSATLAVAINIRNLELRHGVMGAIGSSPTLAIIFAPFTIVHVIISIYLEYFGRPLGIWRTSAKVNHTLSEVLFICAWSAALSLCFDNYFTSVLQCGSEDARKWFSQFPPVLNPLNEVRGSGGVSDELCNGQIALISLVFVGLLLYCCNLVVSLFRILEKVRYHTGASRVRMRETQR